MFSHLLVSKPFTQHLTQSNKYLWNEGRNETLTWKYTTNKRDSRTPVVSIVGGSPLERVESSGLPSPHQTLTWDHRPGLLQGSCFPSLERSSQGIWDGAPLFHPTEEAVPVLFSRDWVLPLLSLRKRSLTRRGRVKIKQETMLAVTGRLRQDIFHLHFLDQN